MPIKDNTVQAVITSPPYWGLREYDIPKTTITEKPDCQHRFGTVSETCMWCAAWIGHYGLEPELRMYIQHTLWWIQEVWRVLRDNGVFFLNMGDCYAGRAATPAGMKCKCKLLVPHRVAIGMIGEGWTLRNDIIWHKTKGLPESVKDRFAKRFENIFMFVKNPSTYFFNLDGVREKHSESSYLHARSENKSKKGYDPTNFNKDKRNLFNKRLLSVTVKGKNPGDVWNIPSQSTSHAHYAIFPEKLVERMMLCSSRPGDVVLDPFAGSGTTGRVAVKFGRYPVLLDLGYHDIQKQRMNNVQKEMVF